MFMVDARTTQAWRSFTGSVSGISAGVSGISASVSGISAGVSGFQLV